MRASTVSIHCVTGLMDALASPSLPSPLLLPTHHLQNLSHGPHIVLLPLNGTLQLAQVLLDERNLPLVHLTRRLCWSLEVVSCAYIDEDAGWVGQLGGDVE